MMSCPNLKKMYSDAGRVGGNKKVFSDYNFTPLKARNCTPEKKQQPISNKVWDRSLLGPWGVVCVKGSWAPVAAKRRKTEPHQHSTRFFLGKRFRQTQNDSPKERTKSVSPSQSFYAECRKTFRQQGFYTAKTNKERNKKKATSYKVLARRGANEENHKTNFMLSKSWADSWDAKMFFMPVFLLSFPKVL